MTRSKVLVRMMKFATYITPKQHGAEVVEENGEEHHGDGQRKTTEMVMC